VGEPDLRYSYGGKKKGGDKKEMRPHKKVKRKKCSSNLQKMRGKTQQGEKKISAKTDLGGKKRKERPDARRKGGRGGGWFPLVHLSQKKDTRFYRRPHRRKKERKIGKESRRRRNGEGEP